ncbi:MAG: hypothetical protein AAGF57_05095 [Pseudomonadota bacterium]
MPSGFANTAVAQQDIAMEYSEFKPLLGLLFFGAAIGFGVWQLISVKREIRQDKERKRRRESAE